MKLLGYVFLLFVLLFFGSIAFNEVKKDVEFRDACYDKGGIFELQDHESKCFEVKEIKL